MLIVLTIEQNQKSESPNKLILWIKIIITQETILKNNKYKLHIRKKNFGPFMITKTAIPMATNNLPKPSSN